MRRLLLSLLAFIITLTLSAQDNKAAKDKRLAGLDTALTKLLKDWNAAGFAVAIVEKDKIIYEQGFGKRNIEAGQPVTPNTLFAIGSCSKAFTSAVFGILKKDGLVDYDKPARLYLPSLNFFNDGMNNNITLRDMMSHRTGLPRHDYSWYLFPTSSTDSILQRIKYQEPTTGIKDKWQYNNFMFVTQGAIQHHLTGKTWEQNIREKFFEPLGMKRSNVSIDLLAKDNDAATGYGLKNDSVINKLDYYQIAAMAPAGAINSSVHEMGNWILTWIKGGKFNGREIIPAPYVKEAITSQMIVSGGFPQAETPDLHFSTYGFGWMMSSYRGHYMVTHGGNINGFSAGTTFFPTDSIGIIVLTNQNGSPLPALIRNMIADRMLGLSYVNWSGNRKATLEKERKARTDANKAESAKQVLSTKPSHELKDYVGSYTHPGYGSMQVKVVNDSLFLVFPKEKFWLKHYHYDVFEPYAVTADGIDTSEPWPIKLQFNSNVDGSVRSLNAPFESGLRLEFERKLSKADVPEKK